MATQADIYVDGHKLINEGPFEDWSGDQLAHFVEKLVARSAARDETT